MKFYGPFTILLGLFTQVWGIPRITLDDDAQVLCKKYKMMCKTDKICAVQHFDWPNNITIPVCIPLSFVPVRNRICQQPPATGRCHARYIRWYYNIHAQECSHFQYGGCEGNGNNFMSKRDCEQTCIATPTIRLYEGGESLLQPSVITAPIYEPQKTKQYEALNSVLEPSGNYDRYELQRHRTNRIRADEAATRTRRRLDKEKEKERKRRERRKEKKRLRKLQKKEQRKLRCKKRRERGKRCKNDKKDRKGRKNKKKKMTDKIDDDNDVSSDKNTDVTGKTNQVVEETKNLITSEIEAVEDKEEKDVKETKREKRRRKRKLKEKRRLEKERNRRNLSSRSQQRYSELNKKSESYSAKLFSILDQGRNGYKHQKNSLLHTLS
ncbi:daf-12-interacting protein 1-like isoform X2 [Ruditapes philippinarum]|uniref:daf-12-interacting protein 1-like isoform X2 n=1 Tax=Ruditapes philippinarum TaxID=129788 RepID=UPI00295BF016|nr:daf-12-interacting protein 1-like isoform X2 [Ruditapes philippinarum]